MRKPQEGEYIVCPEKNEKLIPKEVWDTKKKDGQPISHGVFKDHHHWGSKCPRSGLTEQVQYEKKPSREQKMMGTLAPLTSDYIEERLDFWDFRAQNLLCWLVD